MAFIPENELERILVQAAHDPHVASDFYRLLLDSDLLVLGSIAGQDDQNEQFALEPGDQVNLVPGEKNGVRYLPVFSSQTRMQEYARNESKYLRVNGRALLDLTRGAPVILNPASEYGKELTAGQVQQLLDGPRVTPRVIDSDIEPPEQLMGVLREFFATRPDVQTAWMTMVAPSDRLHEARPLVGIESNADFPSLMQALQAVASATPDVMFDVQRVDRLNPSGVAATLLLILPFYERRSLN
jgi:hypothetical protein